MPTKPSSTTPAELSALPPSAHTPGPWHVDAEPSVCRGIYASHGRTVIASVHSANTMPAAEADANAALIAAAPELLAALRYVRDVFPVAGRLHPRDVLAVQSQICAAIAKAEGGAS